MIACGYQREEDHKKGLVSALHSLPYHLSTKRIKEKLLSLIPQRLSRINSRTKQGNTPYQLQKLSVTLFQCPRASKSPEPP
ncbi:hypothetical protein Pst134EB_003986 [Puccinia striiformis f. sp. tritici]|nr:hypothetical protein Pst134EB_003986 [Puccinia striiformis f. sp. tritici]